MLFLTSNTENPQQHRRQIHLDTGASQSLMMARAAHCAHSNDTHCLLKGRIGYKDTQISGKQPPISGKPVTEEVIPGISSSRNRSHVETGAFWGVGWARFGQARARLCVSHVSAAGARRAVRSSGWGKSRKGGGERERETCS